MVINLENSNSKTEAIPINYVDDNRIGITPYFPNDLNNGYYLIMYESSYIKFEMRKECYNKYVLIIAEV